MQIHIARNGQPMGPFSLDEVNRQLAAGTLTLADQAWYEGAAGWAPLSTVPGVSGAAADSSASIPPTATSSATAASSPGSGPVVPTTVAGAGPTEPLAILSLIFSVVGLSGFCCGFLLLLAIAGVVCGHLALSKIKSTPGLQGHGLALSGVIVGYIAIAGWLMWILFFGGLAVLGSFMDATKT